jgi:DNA invertase Pin-like site-specific DNA recombinase
MILGYCRVSSKGQASLGTSLDDQKRQILNKYPSAIVYLEIFSGMKKRPVFDEIISKVKEGDTLVVTKLDRFCRSASEGITHMNNLTNRGVKVDILDIGVADAKNPSGKLILNIFQCFAEFEANLIYSRTKAGKENKKINNPEWKDGRKKVNVPDFEKYYQMTKQKKITVDKAIKELSITYSKWYRLVKEYKFLKN